MDLAFFDDSEEVVSTFDKVFLLDAENVNACFETDESRICSPTDYAIEQGVQLVAAFEGGRFCCMEDLADTTSLFDILYNAAEMIK